MIWQFLIGDYRNFVYLVISGNDALVVDPQSDLQPWQNKLQQLGARLQGVLLTHTHHDHVAGVGEIASLYPDIPIYVHALDAHRLENQPQHVKERLNHIADGSRIALGTNSTIEVLHTPGHSAGECCFFVDTEKGPALLTGDTVFVGDVGRTDLESGSTAQLFKTIQRLKRLPPSTVIYPGHDYGKSPTSTIARECESSAAFRCVTIEELDALP